MRLGGPKRVMQSTLGPIRHVSYVRHLLARQRSWTDDALLHHAQHPLDLLRHWFGDLRPKGMAGVPLSGSLQEVSLVAELPGGAPVSIDISYSAHLPFTRMTLVGLRAPSPPTASATSSRTSKAGSGRATRRKHTNARLAIRTPRSFKAAESPGRRLRA
jgi:predicted dehydrogenase